MKKAEEIWGFLVAESPMAQPVFHGDERCPELPRGLQAVTWLTYAGTAPAARRAGADAVQACGWCWPEPLPKIKPKRTRRPREEWEQPFVRSAGLPGLGKRR